jgi:hypothetical protein
MLKCYYFSNIVLTINFFDMFILFVLEYFYKFTAPLTGAIINKFSKTALRLELVLPKE